VRGPVSTPCVPGKHGTQSGEEKFAHLYQPAGHGEHEYELSYENSPSLQARQVDIRTLGAYVLFGHDTQIWAADCELIFPAGQAEQLPAPLTSLNVPSAQGTHAVVFGAKKPGGQSRQVVAFDAVEYQPFRQGVHPDWPIRGEKEPGWQGTHIPAASSLNDPAGHA